MMNLMNAACTASLSVILAEDTGAAELRNPELSGMSKPRKRLIGRFLRGLKQGNNTRRL